MARSVAFALFAVALAATAVRGGPSLINTTMIDNLATTNTTQNTVFVFTRGRTTFLLGYTAGTSPGTRHELYIDTQFAADASGSDVPTRISTSNETEGPCKSRTYLMLLGEEEYVLGTEQEKRFTWNRNSFTSYGASGAVAVGRRYPLCFGNGTEVDGGRDASHNVFAGIYLAYVPAAYAAEGTGTTLYLPHRLSTVAHDVVYPALVSATFDSLPSFASMGALSPVYIVLASQSCSRLNSATAMTYTALNSTVANITIGAQSLETLTSSSEYQICFAGSTVFSLTLKFMTSLSISGHTVNEMVNPEHQWTIAGGATRAFSLSTSDTQSNVALSTMNFTVCERGETSPNSRGRTIASTFFDPSTNNFTVTAVGPDVLRSAGATHYNSVVCMKPSGVNVSVPLPISFNVIYIDSLGGVSASNPSVPAYISEWRENVVANPSGSFTAGVSILGDVIGNTYLFAATNSSCIRGGSSEIGISSALTMIEVPHEWLNGSFTQVCVHVDDDEDGGNTGLNPWRLRQLQLSSIRPLFDIAVAGSLSATRYFLVNSASQTVVVAGTFHGLEIRVGVVDSTGGCSNTVLVNAAGRAAILSTTLMTRPSGNLCVTAPTATLFSAGAYAVVKLGSFDGRAPTSFDSSVPAFAMAGGSGRNVTFPVSVSLADGSDMDWTAQSAVLAGMTFERCATAHTGITAALTVSSVAATPHSVTVSLPPLVSGLQALCWRLSSASSAAAVVNLYVVPQLAVGSTLMPPEGFVRRRYDYSMNLRTAPSESVVAATVFAVAIFNGDTCSATSSAMFKSFASMSSQQLNITLPIRASSASTYAVCAGFGSTAYNDSLTSIQYSTPLASLRVFGIVVDGTELPGMAQTTTTLPFVSSGGEIPTVEVSTTPTRAADEKLELVGVPRTMSCTAAAISGQSLVNVAEMRTNDTQPYHVNNALLQARNDVRLCAQFNRGGQYLDIDTIARFSVINSIDNVASNATNSTGNNTSGDGSGTSAPQPIPNVPTGIAALAGASREYMISGNDLDAPQGWRLAFYRTNVSTTADCARQPALAFNASRITSDNVTFQLTFGDAATYAGMCFSALISDTRYAHTVLTTSAIVAPLASFQTGGGTAITRRLQAVEGVPVRYTVNAAPGTTAASFNGRVFVASPSCGVVDVVAANNLRLPVQSDTDGLFVEVPASTSLSSGSYRMCLVSGLTPTTNRQLLQATTTTPAPTTSPAAVQSFDTGLELLVTSMNLNGFAPGSSTNIGHFRGQPLTLTIGGVAGLIANPNFALNVFLDNVACAESTRTGQLPTSGLSREPMAVTSCGTDSASVVVPAASSFTQRPLHVCLLIEDTDTSQTVVVDSNITLTVSSADRLAFTRTFPPKTAVELEFATVPAISMIDASLGTILTTLPFDLTVRGQWIAVEPYVQRIEEPVYRAIGLAGSSAVDFSSANIALPGLHGVGYIMEFTVENRNDIAPVNSSVVYRNKCFTSSQYAVPFTTKCVNCPERASCDGTSVLNVTRSYWRPSNLTLDTFSCGTPYGGENCEVNTELGNCKPGHFGPRCTECEEGYGRAIDTCVPCNPESDWLIVLLFIVFVVIVLLILVNVTISCKKSDQLPIYMKVLVTHLVTAATFGSSSLLLPPFLIDMFQVQTLAASPSPEFAAFDCFFKTRFYDKFIILTVSPAAVAICVVLVLILRAMYRCCCVDDDEVGTSTKDNGQSAAKLEGLGDAADQRATTAHGHRIEDRVMTADEQQLARKRSAILAKQIRRQSAVHFFMIIMVVVLFMGYPSLIDWAVRVTRCDDISYTETTADGDMRVTQRVVYYDRRIDCDSEEAKGYRLAGIVMVLAWGFGIPIVAALLFVRLRASLGRIVASRMFTFVIAGYRSSVWWWEGVLMMRKFAFIIIMSFVEDPRLQSLISFWVLAFHLVAHIIVCPYEYKTVDKMETASLYVLCGTLNLSLLFEWVSVDPEKADTWVLVGGWVVSMAILLFNIGLVLWMLSLILREANVKMKRAIRDNREEYAATCCIGGLLIRYAFSDLREEVVAPALTRPDADGATSIAMSGAYSKSEAGSPKLSDNPRHNLAEYVRKQTVNNMMIVEDDSASDWSENSSDSDDESVVMGNGADEFQLSGLGNATSPFYADGPNGSGNANASMRRGSTGSRVATADDVSGVFVRVVDGNEDAGSYQLGHGNDDQAMSGAYTTAELRRAGRDGDVVDGIDAIAADIGGDSNDGDVSPPQHALQGTLKERRSTAAPSPTGVVPTESEAFASIGTSVSGIQRAHDEKKCAAIIATMRAAMNALRQRANELGAESAEVKAKLEEAEQRVAALEKQLQVSKEYGVKVDQQLAEQHEAIADMQRAVQRLEAENVQLKSATSEADRLRDENAELSMEREQLRSQLRSRPKTSDLMLATLDDWDARREKTAKERDAQMQVLQLEAGLRAERIQDMERKEREEQQRLVAEHIEAKRRARAERLNRPATDGGPQMHRPVQPPRLNQSAVYSAAGSMRSPSPGSMGSKRHVSFASRARQVGQLARAFSPTNLRASSESDRRQLERMEAEGELQPVDERGRPVVVIRRKHAEKLQPMRRNFSMRSGMK